MLIDTLCILGLITSPCMTIQTLITNDLHSHEREPESALVVTIADISLQTAIRASQSVTHPTISLCEMDNDSMAYLVMRGQVSS